MRKNPGLPSADHLRLITVNCRIFFNNGSSYKSYFYEVFVYYAQKVGKSRHKLQPNTATDFLLLRITRKSNFILVCLFTTRAQIQNFFFNIFIYSIKKKQ